ncbi:hypothetical protein LOZ80_31580 [Paenibacillus sp. HWE-109]|uniref:hypothetical protein n=1 Tax=Paenibacillus sp. HWE-109 TaxID=1306526 RepID=UPI001EE0E0E2|nr:hypothetical protein [Paenibacillus sp. HWE-109]UKS26046.1 hypothetical protein LOZ80_31580 [Paenibacillus sp. HWE-109]
MLLNQVFGLPFHQPEVDFLIPNLNEDLQLYVDPFLFYKSGNPEYQAVHSTIRQFFSIAIEQIRLGRNDVAQRMLHFPEVEETMLGVSSGTHKGRGMGDSRGKIIYREIISNPNILEYGVSHLAEMQLLIEGVGFDMVSDMCTNIAKPFFVDYTQRQCKMHNIPMVQGLSLGHVFDWEEHDWDDQHVELPVNPNTGYPILLVPKAVVRRFEDIDYKDFWNTTYRYILRDIEVEKSVRAIGREPKITWKEINEKYNFCKKTVVEVLHEQPELMKQYLQEKDRTTHETVVPVDLDSVEGTDITRNTAKEFKDELALIRPGNKDAKKYESLLLRILTTLFSPPLADPHSQVTTVDGREIIDITFYNSANHGFWNDIKTKHGSIIIVIELKNMEDLNNEEYFQISNRLNDKVGKFGILIARKKDKLDVQRAYRRFNQDQKVILTFTDEDIIQMLDNFQQGLNPSLYINQMYRKFVEEA